MRKIEYIRKYQLFLYQMPLLF